MKFFEKKKKLWNRSEIDMMDIIYRLNILIWGTISSKQVSFLQWILPKRIRDTHMTFYILSIWTIASKLYCFVACSEHNSIQQLIVTLHDNTKHNAYQWVRNTITIWYKIYSHCKNEIYLKLAI